jgi:flagellar FliL protein
MAGGKKKDPKPEKDANPEVEGAEPGAEGAEGGAAKKKLSGKTLILFIVLPAVLIIGGGGAAAMMLLGGGAKAEAHGDAHAGKDEKGKKDEHAKKDDHGKKDEHGKEGKEGEGAHATITEGDGVQFMTLPDMLVNIGSAEGRPAFLKLRLTLEVKDPEVITAIEAELPRVMDQYQTFLRELRVDDLAGSAGSYRLRLELLRRVNQVVAPAVVNAVLIEEMLIQ